MSGFFGIVSKTDCVNELYFGTDYHSHLGTRRGGMVLKNEDGFTRFIHDISNAPFRSKFETDILRMKGNQGIGVISDYEDQPLIIGSHLGVYAIATVGIVNNVKQLLQEAYVKRNIHFSEMSGGEINQTELIATLINQESSFEAGLQYAQEMIEGSCSILLLTDRGIYAARDRLGRTPVIIGERDGAMAATLETTAFPNLGYKIKKYLGPGEIVLFTEDSIEQKKEPNDRLQICAFLWVYYGFPASSYEGINVEETRYRCGAALAKNDNLEIDVVAGVPDSGSAHAIGYAMEAKVPYMRPYVKYTPTWPRSFMPTDQSIRELVAKMKLIPIKELVQGKRLLFAEDSIVRGTQLGDTIKRLFDDGAKEVHMRPACPPLIFGCKFLNFSRSKSELDLAGRKAIKELEDEDGKNLKEYVKPGSEKRCAMIEQIRKRLKLTTLKYQELDNLVKAIGLPKEKLCTYCWDGVE
ncbi:MAG: amidophosphoribosyltransferase [Ignavibacteria bacterium]|nr:amidophosphoribosyltransferase [Ignavibacteria bacterium]